MEYYIDLVYNHEITIYFYLIEMLKLGGGLDFNHIPQKLLW